MKTFFILKKPAIFGMIDVEKDSGVDARNG